MKRISDRAHLDATTRKLWRRSLQTAKTRKDRLTYGEARALAAAGARDGNGCDLRYPRA